MSIVTMIHTYGGIRSKNDYNLLKNINEYADLHVLVFTSVNVLKKAYMKICIKVKRIPESTKTVKSTTATGGERSQIEINGSRETNCIT